MKQLLTFLCTFLLLNAANAQGDCQKFKDGTFKLSEPKDNFESIIVRKGNMQTETLNGDKGTTSSFIVEWTDDCTYTLKPTKATLAKYPNMPATAIITVKIISVKENSYMQTSTSNFSDLVLTHEVVKIK